MVIPSAALLAIPLTVAAHRLKKPFIYVVFNNLMTGETRIFKNCFGFICVQSVVYLWLK